MIVHIKDTKGNTLKTVGKNTLKGAVGEVTVPDDVIGTPHFDELVAELTEACKKDPHANESR